MAGEGRNGDVDAAVAREAAVEQLRGEYAFSQRRSCGLLLMAVGAFQHQSRWDEGLLGECLGLAVDASLPRRRVTRVLDAIAAEFSYRPALDSTSGRGSPAGKPTKNGWAESVNGKLRDGYLNRNLFRNCSKRGSRRLGCGRTHGGGKVGGCATLENPLGFPLSHRPATAYLPFGTQKQYSVSATAT